MKNKDLSVVFLMWIPYGIDYMISFLNSYQEFPAGADHNLVILFNGYQNEDDLQKYHEFLKARNIPYDFLLQKNGQDILAYKAAAGKLSTKYILFFNTYSKILAKNWALYYLTAIKKNNVGFVGATGSWQSRADYGINRVKWIFSNEKKIKENIPYYVSKQISIGHQSFTIHPRVSLFLSFINSLKDIFHFPFSPNPHLRTNAFIVDRIFWLGLEFNSLNSKRDAHLMESGKSSFTRQMLKKQKEVLVINKHGTVFSISSWNISKTLWCDDQEDLLVSDNFTNQYNAQSRIEKQAMSKSIWGSFTKVSTFFKKN
jgi:hypothetical protein